MDGVVRMPSALSMTFGVLPSIPSTHVLFVPRRIPRTLPVVSPLFAADRAGPRGPRGGRPAGLPKPGQIAPRRPLQDNTFPPSSAGSHAHIGGPYWPARLE